MKHGIHFNNGQFVFQPSQPEYSPALLANVQTYLFRLSKIAPSREYYHQQICLAGLKFFWCVVNKFGMSDFAAEIEHMEKLVQGEAQ